MEETEFESKDYEIKVLNMLAFPKNQFPRCELTGKAATVQLVTPHCSIYYASTEVAEQAWFGIIKKISHLISHIEMPAPIIGTSDERAKRAHNINLSKRSVIEFCRVEASKLISVQKYQLAIAAAFQALKYSKEIDGDMSLTVVDPYLQLTQAYLGIKMLSKAEEYLALARWIVLNSEDCPDKTRSRLHMLMGRVNTAQGNFEAAKSDYAKAIFHSSRSAGAEAVATSIGYFRLGDVFLAQAKIESALAIFDKVVDIWYKYLSTLHQSMDSSARQMSGILSKASDGKVSLEEISEEHMADGRIQLGQILEQRLRLLGINHIATGEVRYTIGLFEYFLFGNVVTAEKFISTAHEVYQQQLDENHPSRMHVTTVLELVRQQMEFN